MQGNNGNRKLIRQKFNVLGYLIDAGYMNDEYQTKDEQKDGVQICNEANKRPIYKSAVKGKQ